MRLLRSAIMLAVLGMGYGVTTADAQFHTLGISIYPSHPAPSRPKNPVNTIKEFAWAFAGCWSPPPLDPGRQPIDVIFRVSFKRSGELLGKPPFVEFVQQVTEQERGRYYQAVAEAIERCSQMPFTDSMGGAVAGRVFRINFIDMRNRKQT